MTRLLNDRLRGLLLSIFVLIYIFFFTQNLLAATCVPMTGEQFHKQKKSWSGKTLVGFASWCSSCKDSLKRAASNSDQFVFLVAYDERAAVEAVLTKFQIASPCIAGDDIVLALEVKSLPWTLKL